MRHWKKLLTIVVLTLVGGCVGFYCWLQNYLPENYTVYGDTALVLANTPYVQAKESGTEGASRTVGNTANSGTYSMQLRLFGVVPIKTVWVQQAEPETVMASGAPFGIKLFSKGVMVVGFSDIYTETGYKNPAKSAGLHMGDTIHSIDGVPVGTNEEIQKLVENSEGRPMLVRYSRKGEDDFAYITPVQSAEGGMYRVGMRVRDSSAGIGTLTYYDVEAGIFAGLGHAVTDVDTGESIEVLSGQIVPVSITGVAQSSVGSPGELKGILSAVTAGDITKNEPVGVFGTLRDAAQPAFEGKPYTAAARHEVTVGEAEVLVCIEGSMPKAYRASIERINYDEANPNKNMIVRITDEALLQKTGGIVQGMSGSPIVQNGKLVGAVTHVLVNDPTRGYGIFIENMLEEAE